MRTDHQKNRISEILDFIFEITLGNYHYRLELKNHKDELEEIVLSLNLMVDEIDTMVHQINHEKSLEIIECANIRLDAKGMIKGVTDNLLHTLNYTGDDLINTPISSITTIQAFEQLIHILPREPFDIDPLSQGPFRTEFIHQNGYLWAGDMYINHMAFNDESIFILFVFKSIRRNDRIHNYLTENVHSKNRYPSEYRSLLLRDKRKVLTRLHDYIVGNLHTTLPNMARLAKEVGGSQTKLKVMFKNAYGDSIFKYHKRKRLEKSFILLKDTTLPIGQIAQECGFISFSHFTRSFKKEYGISPSKVRKS